MSERKSESTSESMTEREREFAARAIRRKDVFRILSYASVVVAIVMAIVYGYERFEDPSFALGPRAVIVLLILLNARQNLRQHKHAAILEKLTRTARS